jgi:hypothetical protein
MTGTWSYSIAPSSADAGLTQSGTIAVAAPPTGPHGFVRAVNSGFVFDDGTPYFMLGQTNYDLIGEERYAPAAAHTAITQAAQHGITKLQVIVYPWPTAKATAPFADGNAKHASLDQTHFAALDSLVADASSAGLQVGLELFADNNNAFFCPGSCGTNSGNPTCTNRCSGWPGINAVDDRYVSYVVARYSAYPHVNWELTNEFEYTPYTDTTPGQSGITASPSYWNHIGGLVQAGDPYFVSTTIAGAKRPTSIHSTTNWPVSSVGGTILFPPSSPWVSSTSLQYHGGGVCATAPGGVSSVPAGDKDTSTPVTNATNRASGLPLVVDEWSYLSENRDGCGAGVNDTALRWGIWGAAASGGYSTVGDSNRSPSGSWDANDCICVSSDWVNGSAQGTSYQGTTNLTSFYTSQSRNLPFNAMRFDSGNSNLGARRYAEALPGKAEVVYSAVSQSIPLALPAGLKFNVSAYDVMTGQDVPVPGVSNPVTGTGSAVSYAEPSGMGAVGDWVLYAVAAQPPSTPTPTTTSR